jgi:organic radical activating enzyme
MHSEIKRLHLELSTGCNAQCPVCSRHISINYTDYFYNNRINYKQNLTVEDINNIFSSKNIVDDIRISICGNYGDPFWNEDILKIIYKIFELKPFAYIIIDTNGSLGKKDTWLHLAEISNNLKVNFSIDGLEDTNHIYRRNVKWKKVMENLHTFVSNGGNAQWKYIVFEHNKHQVEKARSLAKELGFKSFDVTVESPMLTPLEYVDKEVNLTHDVSTMSVSRKKIDYNISEKHEYKGRVELPKCIIHKEMYIGADGNVFPCCHFGCDINDTKQQFRDEINEIMQITSIKKQSFHSIVNDKQWNTLHNSIENKPIETCILKCGKYTK